MIKFLRQARDEIAAFIIPLLLVDVTRSSLRAKPCPFVLDEVITDARAERKPVLDIGNRIMQPIQARISVKPVGEQPVILREPVQRLVVFTSLFSP